MNRQTVYKVIALLLMALAFFLALHGDGRFSLATLGLVLALNGRMLPGRWTWALSALCVLLIGGTAIRYVMTHPVDWHDVFITNWDVTLLVLYLPLMGLAGFGYWRWRSHKNKGNI